MIRLLKNATIGGRIRRAGEIVSDISGDMANTFVEAGAAEWPETTDQPIEAEAEAEMEEPEAQPEDAYLTTDQPIEAGDEMPADAEKPQGFGRSGKTKAKSKTKD